MNFQEPQPNTAPCGDCRCFARRSRRPGPLEKRQGQACAGIMHPTPARALGWRGGTLRERQPLGSLDSRELHEQNK